jgi:hypothetical protein
MVQAIERSFQVRQKSITQIVRTLEIALVPKKENFWGIDAQSFAQSRQGMFVNY